MAQCHQPGILHPLERPCRLDDGTGAPAPKPTDIPDSAPTCNRVPHGQSAQALYTCLSTSLPYSSDDCYSEYDQNPLDIVTILFGKWMLSVLCLLTFSLPLPLFSNCMDLLVRTDVLHPTGLGGLLCRLHYPARLSFSQPPSPIQTLRRGFG
jgi:hypothetical protein